jgi:hypothetical protein
MGTSRDAKTAPNRNQYLFAAQQKSLHGKNVAIYRCEADKKLPVVIRLTGSQHQIVS